MTSKESKKASNDKYYRSEKGKLTLKARQDRYIHSEKGKQSIARRHERYAETIKGRAFLLYASAKQRAKKRNLPFTITRDIVETKLIATNGRCEVTNTPLNSRKRTDVKKNPFAPSLDQKVPGAGYTPENIQIVAVWYNQMKMDMSDAEAIQIILECNDGILQKRK